MKRFTETTKWSDPWFRRLAPELKSLWLYLLDSCDNAGVIDIDYELAFFMIGKPGYEFNDQMLAAAFGDRVRKLENGKHCLTGFVAYQYGELSWSCPPHRAVLSLLKKHGIDTLVLGYCKCIERVEEKDKEKEEEKEKDKEMESAGKLMQPKTPVCGHFVYPNDEGVLFRYGSVKGERLVVCKKCGIKYRVAQDETELQAVTL